MKSRNLPRNEVILEVGQTVAAELMKDADQGETMRLVMEIPAAWAKLAAWRFIRMQYREKRELEPTLDAPTWGIKLPPELGHKAKAKAELYRVLDQWFHEAVADLWNGEAFELTELPSEQTLPPEEQAKKITRLDDDIPF